VQQLLHRAVDVGQIDHRTDVAAAAQLLTGAMRGIHKAVFDGASPDVALDLVNRVHLLVPVNQ
jgi:hypothetical protein